ncbi:MAG: hypothetical protein ACLTKE_09735 [Coprococcus sp.]
MYAYRPVIERNISIQPALIWMMDMPVIGSLSVRQSGTWKQKMRYSNIMRRLIQSEKCNGDGQAWDIDWSDGTVYQCNYSHNNGGGSMLICLNEAYNGTFRYNLSHNDLGCLITFQGNPEAKIYNNVFYVDGDRATRVHHNASGKRKWFRCDFK